MQERRFNELLIITTNQIVEILVVTSTLHDRNAQNLVNSSDNNHSETIFVVGGSPFNAIPEIELFARWMNGIMAQQRSSR